MKTSFAACVAVMGMALSAATGVCAETASTVASMFDAMRGGDYAKQYEPMNFPNLSWKDIPELLTHVDSTNSLTSFPVNGVSSLRISRCKEGMVALWLIEGIRVGRRFPSLIPECYDRSIPTTPRALFYPPARQATVVAAYTLWWKKVEHMTSDEGARYDPLVNTELTWFGGRIPKDPQKPS
jgi:hypothetical protein